MGSRGRIPPPYMRVPHPALGMVHAEPFGGPAIRPPPVGFSPLDMLPPPEVLEQKAAAQHIEMERLATENQRLAATHGTLRQHLAATQQELNMLEARTEAVKSEREQRTKGLVNKISKLEAELREAEPVKLELQQAHAEAQGLVKERDQLFSKVQQMGQDLQKARADLQQIPGLMAELDGLRQEYQHCRATFDYEKKLYSDHLETLQVMEKNYMTMAQEVENLRAELNNTANKPGASYSNAAEYGDNNTSRHPTSEKGAYLSSYSAPQGHTVQNANAVTGDRSTTPTYGHVVPQPGQGSARPGYNVPPKGPGFDVAARGPGYDVMPRGSGYDVAPRGPSYDAQRGSNYDPQGGPALSPYGGPSYGIQRLPAYDPQRAVAAGAGYNVASAASYDPQVRGAGSSSGPVS